MYSNPPITKRPPGDARPTALQIVKDAGCEDALIGKVILITGCSSGLGIETARALYHTGATLYLTARDMEKAKSALGDIMASTRVRLLHLDFNSLASVRACAEEFNSKSNTLNVLIANAGVMACPEAQFLLFYLLKSRLLCSSTPAFNSRVVIVASSAHCVSYVHFDNLSLEGEYEPWKAYGQSKTANIWTANEIERRYDAQGLHAFSLHPGAIMTELLRHVSGEQKADWERNEFLTNYWKSPEQGAATTVRGAVARELEGTESSTWMTVKSHHRPILYSGMGPAMRHGRTV
ncbi:short-chain dehydrogenase [Penicillium argentinense]|uniref:Short-chain dehydrogenase n=1 Tax=Penicillium argentinense TaxID=1131581 RepID=A0A9W9FFR1_9EURO|nr:short-chain dehydrogenase [Penicillium argentinense]KAJ5099274.1 short-chain dehydrogenase [Penicillium argentinense]